MAEEALEDLNDSELFQLLSCSEILRKKKRRKMIRKIKSVLDKDLKVKQNFEKILEQKKVILAEETVNKRQTELEIRKVQNWIDGSFVQDEVIVEVMGLANSNSNWNSTLTKRYKGIISLIDNSQVTVTITHFDSFDGWTKENIIPFYYFDSQHNLLQFKIGESFCFDIQTANTKNNIEANLICSIGCLTLKIVD